MKFGRLGELESAVMQVLWRSPDGALVRDVRAALAPERPLAYTTVMTVMDNLHTKGWVTREREGRAYRYQTVSSREEYAARLMQDALAEGSDRVGTLVTFADQLSADDVSALRAAVRRRRGTPR